MSYIGSTVNRQVTFYDTAGALADPTVVNGNAKTPSGLSVAADTIENLSTGVYNVLFNTNEVGLWFYRVEGEGNSVDVVTEGSFCVTKSSVE